MQCNTGYCNGKWPDQTRNGGMYCSDGTQDQVTLIYALLTGLCGALYLAWNTLPCGESNPDDDLSKYEEAKAKKKYEEAVD